MTRIKQILNMEMFGERFIYVARQIHSLLHPYIAQFN